MTDSGAVTGVGNDSGPGSRPRVALDTTQMLEVLRRAHWTLWPLLACSIVTLGLILERWFSLRTGRILPREFTERFLDRLRQGKLDRDRAIELCKTSDSVAGRVLGHAVRQWGHSSLAIRQIVAQDAAAEVLDLRRNVRLLQGVATIAPLLGLFGTVIGLIQAFDALGDMEGMRRGEALAEGISVALIATAVGLGIAVLALLAYYHFLGRIDTLVGRIDEITRQVIDTIAANGPEGGYGCAPPGYASPGATGNPGLPVSPTSPFSEA